MRVPGGWYRRRRKFEWKHESDYNEVKETLLATLRGRVPMTMPELEAIALAAADLPAVEVLDAIWLMIGSGDLVYNGSDCFAL